MTPSEARAELTTIAGDLKHSYPKTPRAGPRPRDRLRLAIGAGRARLIHR